MDGTTGPVLVLNGNRQAGLAVVQSLGREGVPVTVGSHRRVPLARLSQYSEGTYVHPDPEAGASAFITDLLDFLHETTHDTVIPVADSTTTLLSKHKGAVEATGTTAAVADWETYEQTYDKGRTFDLAASLSVPIPETHAPDSLAAVDSIADQIPYPAVIKPRSKTVWDGAGQCHYTTIDDRHYVESASELTSAYASVLAENPFLQATERYPLVQEYVDGTTTTTVVLADQGEVLAHFQEERLRTYPPSGGNSTLLRARSNARMAEYAATLIEALEWTGPAMVEFMQTADDEFSLIEVNGRYWGSVPFAIACGVDFPWLHYQLLGGERPEPVHSYDLARREQRLLFGDLKWLLQQLSEGNLRALSDFLQACLTAKQTFLSVSDPVPTAGALLQALSVGAKATTGLLCDAISSGSRPSRVRPSQ